MVILNIVKPYDFALSLRVIRTFQPDPSEPGDRMHFTARVEGTPALIEVSQNPAGDIIASTGQEANANRIREMAEWVLFAELDLAPFYRLINQYPRLSFIQRHLHGIKPVRPVSLFEMAVIAITEQQISLAAAYKIRSRLVQSFGEALASQWIFPKPLKLAQASFESLQAVGLSRQKAQYIQNLAAKIIEGTLNLEVLKTLDDEAARQVILNLKGFGRWSADYILIRGLARPDCVPVNDLAIRSVVGEYLGDGLRVESDAVTTKLEPFRPYRGLLAFYLLAAHRLKLPPQ
jgi:DNA-3-methyladenine glycosylase II